MHLLVNHRLVCYTIYVSSQLFVVFNYISLCRTEFLLVQSLQIYAFITYQIQTYDLQSWKHQCYLVNGSKTLPRKAFIHCCYCYPFLDSYYIGNWADKTSHSGSLTFKGFNMADRKWKMHLEHAGKPIVQGNLHSSGKAMLHSSSTSTFQLVFY